MKLALCHCNGCILYNNYMFYQNRPHCLYVYINGKEITAASVKVDGIGYVVGVKKLLITEVREI